MAALIRALRLDQPLVITCIALMFAMPLSLLAAGDNVLGPDVTITRLVQAINLPGISPTVAFLNDLGSIRGLFAVAGTAGLLLIYAGRWPDAIFTIAPLAIAQMTNTALKLTFSSPRPTSDFVAVEHSGSGLGLGFPSGHTMMTVILAGSLTYILVREFDCRWRRGLTISAAIIIALGMGFSRVYVGAHWPTDVLGAYLWGIIFVGLMVLIHPERHRSEQPRPAAR